MTEPPETDTTSAKQPAAFPVSPLVGIFIVVLIYFGAGEIGKILFGIVATLFRLDNSNYSQFGYTFLVQALTILFLVLFMRSSKVSFASIGLIKPKLVNFAAALAGYASYFVLNGIAVIAATYLFRLDTSQQQQLGFETVSSVPQLAVTFISLVILPPLVEEIVMRGFLFSSLKRGMTVVKAALLTSVLFAVAHLQLGSGAPPLWLAAVDTFVLSLILCALRQKTGNLWAGIAVHMLKNFLAFTVIFILPHTSYRL